MIRLEKKCKECGKIEVSEVKFRPIFGSNNWICHDCQTKISERIIKEREEEERKKEEEYRIHQEKQRQEKEKWEQLLNSESVSKLEDMMEKHCYHLPGTCSTWKCSSGDKIVFTKSNEIKALGRWGEEQKPTLFCGKCYLNHDYDGREKKKKLIEKDVIDTDKENEKCDDCNKNIPGRDWYLGRGYYKDEINKTGILCRDCKGKEIDKLATYEKEETQMITEKGEEENKSNNQLSTTQKQPINNQKKNNELDDLKKKVNDLQIKSDDKDKIIQIQADKIKELEQLLDKSRRELINKKIDFKEDKLEELIQELEIDRVKIIQLRNACEQLIRAKNNCNLTDIKQVEETIEGIKNELLSGKIKSEDMRKIFHKCEKIAKLRLKREQTYEAKQEIVLSPMYKW